MKPKYVTFPKASPWLSQTCFGKCIEEAALQYATWKIYENPQALVDFSITQSLILVPKDLETEIFNSEDPLAIAWTKTQGLCRDTLFSQEEGEKMSNYLIGRGAHVRDVKLDIHFIASNPLENH